MSGDDRAFFLRYDYADIHTMHIDPYTDHIAASLVVDAVHKGLRGKVFA